MFIPGVISQLVHKNEVANCSVIWILIANTLPLLSPPPPQHTHGCTQTAGGWVGGG